VRDRQPPIDDVALATSWWSAFADDRKNDDVNSELIGEDGVTSLVLVAAASTRNVAADELFRSSIHYERRNP
jgi:hypothetical protein